MSSAYRNRSGLKQRGTSRGRRASEPGLAAVRLSLAVAILVCSASLFAADDGSTNEAGRPSRSIFRLRELFRRDRSPDTPVAPVSDSRFLSRARQLLNDARKLEEAGQADRALETARRAESVIRAARLTAGVRWPDTDESPGQYIAALKQRTGVTDGNRSEAGRGTAPVESVTPRVDPKSIAMIDELPAGRRESIVESEEPGRRTSSVTHPVVGSTSGIQRNLVLDWGRTAPGAGIELTAGVQGEPTSENSNQSTDESDESRLLLEQLGVLESPELSVPVPPLMIPGLIDRPDEIDDRHVSPIPTRPTDSVPGTSSSTVTTTIPVVPDSLNGTPAIVDRPSVESDENAEAAEGLTTPSGSVYDASPRLLTQSDSSSAPVNSGKHDASVWQLAAAQLLSTFVGVVLAVGLFLLVRAAASRFFGTRLGVTFHFSKPSIEDGSVHSGDDSTSVVPFHVVDSGESIPSELSHSDQPRRAGGVAHPEDFPFRIIGAGGKQDEERSEGQGAESAEGSILKSVFENNLALMDNLSNNKESAA